MQNALRLTDAGGRQCTVRRATVGAAKILCPVFSALLHPAQMQFSYIYIYNA